jgi:hypothetical protein
MSYCCITYPVAEGSIFLEDSNAHFQFEALCAVPLNQNFTQYSAVFDTVVSGYKTSKEHVCDE